MHLHLTTEIELKMKRKRKVGIQTTKQAKMPCNDITVCGRKK